MKTQIGVVQIAKSEYPNEYPYHPSEIYPEYPFRGHISRKINLVYAGVRQLFLLLGFDSRHQGTSKWNPLGHIIKPGMTIIIKPNFLHSRHLEGKDLFSIITHPSVLRTIIDYCWISLKGDGRIIITDAPNYDCDFHELLDVTKIDKVIDFYSSIDGPHVELYDLRNYWGKTRIFFLETRHMSSCLRKLPGDPKGSVIVNLGGKSAFYNHPHPERFYGAVFDRQETVCHHSGDRQEYQISKTILDADVFISVPKIKVHRKVGVTLNMKGLVGTCTNKNFLVHFCLGTPSEGGDQFPDKFLTPMENKIIKFERWMYDYFLARRSIWAECIHRIVYGFFYLRILQHLGLKVSDKKRLLDKGSWYGNDSIWRMPIDLLKIIYFSDRDGKLHNTQQRRLFSVIDGIVGGENKGPLVPDPKPIGILIGGESLLAADVVATRLMGFDPFKLKQFSVLSDSDYNFGLRNLEDIEVISNESVFQKCLENKTDRFFSFKPHPGWVGHIEI